MIQTNDKWQEAIRLLSSKIEKGRCPMCGSTKGFVFEPKEFQLKSFQNPVNGEFSELPVLIGECENCGYVVLFDSAMYLK